MPKLPASSGGQNLRSERGQAILEYGVIAVLILIAIASFLAIFGPDLQVALFPATPTPVLTPTPSASLYDILETGSYTQIDDSLIITTTANCTSTLEITQTVPVTRSIEHIIIIETEATASVISQITQHLEEHYGFSNEQTEDLSFDIPIGVLPNSQAAAEVEWQYLWQEGRVQVTRPDGSQENYLYRARTGFEWQVVNTNSVPYTCTP